MRQDPFPSPEWNGEEPDGLLPPGGLREEGLFICVPAGELDADRCKQAQGWWLDQPEPGVLVWRTPSGRSYATAPTEYPR